MSNNFGNNLITIKINGAEELSLEVEDKSVLEAMYADNAVLLNVVQQYIHTEIESLEIVGKENISEEARPIEKIWTDENTKLLIDLYKVNSDAFESREKKNVWHKIASNIVTKTGLQVTGMQCDTKWKGLVKQYKNIKKHNDTSGNEPNYWKFFDLLDEILHKKPEITPVATCSSARGLCLNSTDDETSSSEQSKQDSPALKKKKMQRSKNAVEKRHREKMERQDKFLALLEKMAENIPAKECKCDKKE